ncbi:unnamed protein product [marine sediment metagenome]|uniref:LicD/FKTN/FKRP nucleotidyltransferase domain-containing protein n=1 Tax=marine sediment metagenome TaxID=412755 RepID=X1JCQ5_9ZZZZ
MFEAQIERGLAEEVYKKETLFKWADMMEDLGYKFFMLYGSLLGAVRNNRLLPWDVDIDLLFIIGDGNEMWNPEEDFDVFDIVREANRRGFKKSRFGHYYGRGPGEWCKYPELLKLPLDQQMKAFMNLEREWGRERFGANWKGKRIDGFIRHQSATLPLHLFKTYSEVELYGRKFRTPGDAERWLTIRYGSNWRKVFCTHSMWVKYAASHLRKGIIPEEVRIFMEEFKAIDKGFRG